MTNQVAFGRRNAPISAPPRAPLRPAAVEEAEERASARAKLYVQTSGMERLLAGLPLFTLVLIALLWTIFQIELRLAFDIGPGGEISRESTLAFGGLSYDLAIGQREFWRLGLAALLHGSNAHVIGNLIALTLVAIQLEPILGRGWFAAIFALSALGGEVGSLIGNAPFVPTVGASGAITGVIAASIVMSFSADTVQETSRMLRRALFFGAPAVVPLIWASHDAGGAQGGTDYFAHFGGAVTGAVVAFVIDQTWDRAYFRPPFNGFAAALAAAMLGVSLLSAGLASRHYAQYEALSHGFIPLADLGDDLGKAAERAEEFRRSYPNDPLTGLLMAINYMKHERSGEAETELRAVMAAPTPLRPEMEPSVHDAARAFLAALLQAERRGAEALDVAAPLCGSSGKPKAIVVQAKLCPTN